MYIYQHRDTTVMLEIPKGNARCPQCNGMGEVRIGYDGQHHHDNYWECPYCSGAGYVSEDEVIMVPVKEAMKEPNITDQCARCGHILYEHRSNKCNPTKCHTKGCDCKGFMVNNWKKKPFGV
jgi:hypothetical protein